MPTDPTGIRLVAGLGNPGLRYRGTRHNIGFLVLDRLAAELGSPFSSEKRWQADVARANAPSPLCLVKPQTFMNLSGESIAPIARYLRVETPQILAVVDDIDLPWGRLRLRVKGSPGGHNGLRSMGRHLGSDEFPRLRVGVGRPEGGRDVSAHVLGRFSPEEKDGLAKVLERATLCVLTACREGIPTAMNTFNVVPGDDKPPTEAS